MDSPDPLSQLEIAILESFKGTARWQIIDATVVWKAAMRLAGRGLLEKEGRARFRLSPTLPQSLRDVLLAPEDSTECPIVAADRGK